MKKVINDYKLVDCSEVGEYLRQGWELHEGPTNENKQALIKYKNVPTTLFELFR